MSGTQTQQLTQKSTKSMEFQHCWPQKDMKFGPHYIFSGMRNPDLTKLMQKDANFQQFQNLHSLTPGQYNERK